MGNKYWRGLVRSVPVSPHDVFMDGDGMDPAHDHSDVQICFHYDKDMYQKLQLNISYTKELVDEGNEGRVTHCLGWFRDPRGARHR